MSINDIWEMHLASDKIKNHLWSLQPGDRRILPLKALFERLAADFNNEDFLICTEENEDETSDQELTDEMIRQYFLGWYVDQHIRRDGEETKE